MTPDQLRDYANLIECKGPLSAKETSEHYRAHAAALEEVSRIERLVYVPGAWKCAKCNLRLITTTLDAGSGRMAADCSPQECANGCGPMWRVTERDAGNDLVDRLDRAEAALAYVRKTLDEARPGMDEGAPIEAIVRKVVSALAESERRAERLKVHADRMRQILTIGDGGFPCRAVADYDAEFKGE